MRNNFTSRFSTQELQLCRYRLEAEFARDRENLSQFYLDQILEIFNKLSQDISQEEHFALLIQFMRQLVDFEHIVILMRNLDENDKISVMYASHEALKNHPWELRGEIARAFDNDLLVLNNPAIAAGFESEDYAFRSITKSVMLVPLILHESQLVFVIAHSRALTLDLFNRNNMRRFQPFLAQAVLSIEYRSQLEEAVKTRTHELMEYQEKIKSFRKLSKEIFWATDSELRFIPVFASDESELSHKTAANYNVYLNFAKGKQFADIVDKEAIANMPDVREQLIACVKNHELIDEVEIPLFINGQTIWALVTGEPYFDNRGKFLGYRGALLDVTSEHLKTLELQKARDSAEIANRSKSEYLAVMSHEIKTPLQAILGMLDLLEQTDIDETQRTYIRHVSQSASLLQTILHDVLDLSRIESQAMVLENISFDIRFAINSTIIQMREKAEAKGIELTLFMSENFPQMIVGDQHRLSQILFNLINNAIKFTAKGGVHVKAERFENRLKFSVTDTGTGIPSEHLEDLFKPFVQLDGSISRKYGGTGLGLAICKRLVEHMGGKIGVKSIYGEGSTFWFEVPCKVPTSPLIGVKAIRKAVEHKERHYNILLVEDSQINQFVIKTMLEKLGHKVTLAGNGVEAIEATKAKLPDLILMDLHMPVMDGVEATKHIMTEIAPVPIVALTANSSDEERIKCRKVGMVSLASKPVTTATLKKLLEDLEEVIEEANDDVAKGKLFTMPEDANEETTTQPAVTSTLGSVSSKGRSNAALIDALIKDQLRPATTKGQSQRTYNDE